VKIFQGDTTGAISLEVVRLLNRMIKESKYRVNPNVLSCLLHLRLRTEIGVRASKTLTEREPVKGKSKEKRGKGTAATKMHLSKKAKKVLKEKEAVRKDMREAEVEVDKEERDKTVWEQLEDFPWAKAFSLAHRDIEARLRSLLSNSQKPIPNTAPARRATGNRQVFTPSQR
jgi:nucleolar complex protein 3